MGLDLGSAPRGDPRVAHVSERYFSSLFFATHACHLILWGRGRIAGVTEIRPRKFDRYAGHLAAGCRARTLGLLLPRRARAAPPEEGGGRGGPGCALCACTGFAAQLAHFTPSRARQRSL